jgi:hypothetical protein
MMESINASPAVRGLWGGVFYEDAGSADRLEKFTKLTLMVGDLADGGLNHHKLVIKADNDTSGIHNMVILKYLHRIFSVKGLLKVPVSE